MKKHFLSFSLILLMGLFKVVSIQAQTAENTFDFSDRTVTILATEEAANYGADATAKAGNIMLAINMQIKGKKNEEYSSVMDSDFNLVDNTGKKYYSRYKHTKEPSIKLTTLKEGMTMEGWIVFEVPASYKTKGLTLTMKQLVTTRHKLKVIK